MVIVQNGESQWARVTLRGGFRGPVSTAIMKGLPVRRWIKGSSEGPGHWEIPYHSIDDLRTLLSSRFPMTNLITETSVQRKAIEYKKRIKKLKRLQLLGLTEENLEIEVPGFTGILPPFQQAGVKFMNSALTRFKNNKGVLLGDVVGLGKTVQVIATSLWLQHKDKIDIVIAVVPASIKIKWGQEITKFCEERFTILQTKSQCGGTSPYKEQFMDSGIFFYIVNYDIIWRMKKELTSIMDTGRCLLILDECQYIKNASAKRTQAAFSLSDHAEYVIEMSATFLENTVTDLFNVFKVLNPNILGYDAMHFDRRYVQRDWWGQPVGFQNLTELHRQVSPFIIRRRKEQVRDQLKGLIADQIIETDIHITLSVEHRRIYNEVKSQVFESLKDLERAQKIKQAELLALITYLRQAALSTSLVGAEAEVSSKLKYLLTFMEGFDPEAKIVIFCFFVKMCDEIGKAIKNEGYKTYIVHGQNTTKRERADIVNAFLVDDYRVLVASDVLKVGQDLYSAAYLVNFDLLWNPRAMDQRKGRIDRVGQQNEILYMYNLIADGTIEDRMMEVIETKDDLFLELAESGQRDSRLTTKRLKGLLDMELNR